jgi:hypothetical protein
LAVKPKSGDTFTITDLRIVFAIEKTGAPEPNTAAITVYNLSDETSAKVTMADNHIRLRAGDPAKTIFFGHVLCGTRRAKENDYITELLAQDGRAALAAARVSLSFAKDVEAATVALALLDALGLPFKGEDKIPEGAAYPFGFCFIGMAGDGLKKVLNRFGLSYTVQNEMVYLLKQGEAAEHTGLTLTPENGLLAMPQPVRDKTGEYDPQAEAVNRWRFSTKLIPELIPGALCKVEADTFTGDLLIHTARYEGDNREGVFLTDLEAEAL